MMKRQTHIWLVIFMSIALSGIIAVQTIWINNAWEVKQDQFDSSVIEVLSSVAKRIEKERNADYITAKVDRIITDSVGNIFVSERNNNNCITSCIDSAGCLIISSEVIDESAKEHMIVQVGVISDPQDDTTLTHEISKVDQKIVKVISSEKEMNWIDKENDSLQIKINLSSESHIQGARNLTEIIQEMVLELDAGSLIDKALVPEKIDSLICNLLAEKDLSLDYQFALADQANDTLYKFTSSLYDKSRSRKDYNISLFPNDLVNKSLVLSVQFPETSVHILKSLLVPISGSVIFSMAILLVFAFTIKTLLKQKKVSIIKSDFINNMTHEFKTPIASIEVAVNSLCNPAVEKNSEEFNYFTNIIKRENKRMNSQVERVLELSLIDNSSLNLNLTRNSVHNILSKVIDDLSIQLERKGATVTFSPAATQDYCILDDVHFYNVVANLIDNAIKYNSNIPEITIETFNQGNMLAVSIADNGIGITREQQTKVFDRFYRTESSNIHNVKGFGLGLSYVKSVITLMNGTISLESEPGKGSTFVILLHCDNEK